MRVRTRSATGGFDTFQASMPVYKRTSGVPKGVPVLDSWAHPLTTWVAAPLDQSREITSDENHKVDRSHFSRGHVEGDAGGPFDNKKFGRRISHASSQTLATYWQAYIAGGPEYQYRYNGPVLAVDPSAVTVSSSDVLRRNLKPIGTTAIARCKPTNHISDLAIDMFEIYREGLPRLPGIQLWEGQTRAARRAGGEYLNVEFGWKPLIGDIHNACYAAANSEYLMKKYEENSGKPVRSSYGFPVVESVSSSDAGATDGFIGVGYSWESAGLNGGFLDQTKSQPRLIRTTTFSRETWFAGSFTYHLPTIYKSRNRLARIAAKAGHLYGIELTPDIVWQASPWTWAVDWFSNMGDVVSNLSDWATDGLVMQYGYLMEHIVSETRYALDRPSRWKLINGGYAIASPVTAFYESKQRVKATPFGFETTWNMLSARQLAIAAALAITRYY